MNGDREHELTRELVAELRALLERARRRRIDPGVSAEPAATALQRYALELRNLCQRVLEEADEPTATSFWELLVELAARHGRRSGGWPT